MDNISNIVKICDEITYIWKQYMETCKKYKIHVEYKIKRDIIDSLKLTLTK